MDTKALRQKILDLAIRGKLVPQDPNDEPAEVLLERIREQKQQMLKEGKLKKKDLKNDTIIFKGEDNLHYEKFQDGSKKCIDFETDYEIPDNWLWCNLGLLFNHNTGKALNSSNSTGKALTYITTSNVYWNRFELNNLKSMPFADSELEKCTVKKGDLLVCEGGDIGRAAIWNFDDEIRIQNHLHRLRVYDNVETIFYYYVLYLYKLKGKINGKGIGLQGLSSSALHSIIVPVPPIAEQKKIVMSIEKMISIIDIIESDNDILTSCINNAKSKILDLAIRGKLVPQDPNDEPASVLLERIQAEKEELIKQGKIKRDKKESVIFKGDDNSYYGIHLSDGWSWASLREISLSISDGSHNPPPDNGSGIPLLSAANINDNSILMNEISRWITNEEWKIENQRTNIEVGDVLLTIVGSIGRSAVVQNNNHFALQRSVAVIKPYLINPLYLMHIVQSPQIQKWLNDNSKGTAQKGIYLNALSLMTIPIPPLAEQVRIVEQISSVYNQLNKILEALT
jgi:type I restriction enzyme S subunit